VSNFLRSSSDDLFSANMEDGARCPELRFSSSVERCRVYPLPVGRASRRRIRAELRACIRSRSLPYAVSCFCRSTSDSRLPDEVGVAEEELTSDFRVVMTCTMPLLCLLQQQPHCSSDDDEKTNVVLLIFETLLQTLLS